MDAIPRYKMSKAEKRAMSYEVARQAREISERLSLEIEAALLYSVRVVSERHNKAWGKDMLRELYDTCAVAIDELVNKYEMRDDSTYVILRELLKIGVDVEAWNKEPRKQLVFHIDKER
jgi:hypothetical protein